MNKTRALTTTLAAAIATLLGGNVGATEPCGDFGECKVLVEINSSDGDIGFHFLMDGDDLLQARIDDPNGAKIFQDAAKGPLARQYLTETFVESAEPLCWADPEADPDEEIVTLEEFLERWTSGTYVFSGRGEEGEMSSGETELTFARQAEERGLEYMTNYFLTIANHYELMSDHFADVGGYDSYASAAELFRQVGLETAARGYCQVNTFGTPEQIVEKLRARRALIGDFELNMSTSYGGMPSDEVDASVRLFAAEVLPELRRW